MKKLLALFMLSVAFVTAQAQNETPYLTKSLSGTSVQKLVARTSGGSLSVTGQTSGENRVEVYIKSSNGNDNLSKEEIQKRLDADYELSVGVEGGQVNAIAKQKSSFMNWKKGLSISFKIYVNPNITTELHTSGGSIALRNLKGKQDFSTSGGSLNIDQLSGDINGKTSGGSIHVTNSNNQLNLSTSGGSIYAEGCKGDMKLHTSGGSLTLKSLNGSVDASTSGGSIKGNDITAETIVHTSGGSISLENIAGSLDASTSGGSINARITKLGKYVKLGNSGGGISLSVPDGQGLNLKLHSNRVNVANLKNFSGSKSDHELDGTLNGGGVPVEARAGSGSIMLTFN